MPDPSTVTVSTQRPALVPNRRSVGSSGRGIVMTRWGKETNEPWSRSQRGSMSLPKVVSREEWLVARRELLVREKELTRRRDALNADRRRLPMVEIEKEYLFEGPDGNAALLDLFEGRRQLIIGHFMFDPRWKDGCPSCSAGADELSPGLLEHLRIRDTSFAYVSRAPIE